MSQNSRNQGYSYYFCMMIEGSGSRRHKNMWIRIRNTGCRTNIVSFFKKMVFRLWPDPVAYQILGSDKEPDPVRITSGSDTEPDQVRARLIWNLILTCSPWIISDLRNIACCVQNFSLPLWNLQWRIRNFLCRIRIFPSRTQIDHVTSRYTPVYDFAEILCFWFCVCILLEKVWNK